MNRSPCTRRPTAIRARVFTARRCFSMGCQPSAAKSINKDTVTCSRLRRFGSNGRSARGDDEQSLPVLGDTMVSRIDHMRRQAVAQRLHGQAPRRVQRPAQELGHVLDTANAGR